MTNIELFFYNFFPAFSDSGLKSSICSFPAAVCFALRLSFFFHNMDSFWQEHTQRRKLSVEVEKRESLLFFLEVP